MPDINPSHTITGRMAAAFIDSKLTVVLMLAALIFGIWAVMTTPREENPQISMPAAAVIAALPGAEPAEVEAKLVRPLEAIINQIPGVDHVWSTAQDSGAMVMVQFKVGEDKEVSLVKLGDRVVSGIPALPKEAVGPWIKSADVDDVPILAVSLVSDKYGDYGLKRIAQSVLDDLLGLDSISTVDIYGGRDRELVVTADPAKLTGYGVSFTQLRIALAATNVAGPLGKVVEDGHETSVRLFDFVKSAEDLKNLVIAASPDGRTVHLGDVAEVTDGPDPHRDHSSRFGYGASMSKYNGANEIESVTLAIAKRKASNAVTVADDAIARIERMKGVVIPADVDVIITRNDGEKANDAVNTLIEHLGIAILSVVAVTVAFLGWRAATIVAITVPLILAITLGCVGLAGFTINRLTLYALIIALGLLVDDSIVVIENIVRHYGLAPLTGRADKLHRSVEAPGEIGSATLLATIAVMVVFASLIPALTGMPKQYFYPIGFTVPVALAASFIIAYTVAPWAALRWLPAPKPKPHEAKTENSVPGGWFGRFYSIPASKLLGYPNRERIFILALLVIITAAFAMPFWQLVRPEGPGGPTPALGIQMGFLPKDNKNTFNVTIEMPAGTPVEVTDRAVRDVAELVSKIPEVKNWQSWSGLAGVPDFNSMMRMNPSSGASIGAVRVNFTDKKTRERSTIDIARELREAIVPLSAKWPGSTIQVLEDPPGPPLKGTVYAELYAKDPELLRWLSDRVKEEFWKTYDMAEVLTTEKADTEEWRLSIDREKALRSGVLPAVAAAELKALTDGTVIGWAHAEGERTGQAIRVQVPRSAQFDPTFLSGITVKSFLSKEVPLAAIVKAERTNAARPISKKDGVRMAAVGGELGHTTPTYAVLDLERRLSGLELPGGGTLKTGNLTWDDERPDLTAHRAVLLWQGEMRMMLDSYRDLAKSLVISIGGIFLILVAYYRSFALASIALAAVPLCFIGIFPGHWLMGVQFSASSLIGVTALSGVVTRSSLLIIDFVIDYLKAGLPLKDALIDAGAVRLRPIMLTTLAIILGSVILITDPVFGGLAITFIFGTGVSTVFTLFLVPVLLNYYFEKYPYKPEEEEAKEA
ncbi:efflux RND transporter permease subunit [Sutterella sp.]|uniref:efflux RND transporter permease subunit n=1 Tax=Sutterella sp. TaxID=1981025 RepID=UPI0026DF15C5|nr:efflux RND transporter permease subunit [Sutterella sp.]MDO5531472.1 efflux RND transporter permease subunit [Sutterella sp.]